MIVSYGVGLSFSMTARRLIRWSTRGVNSASGRPGIMYAYTARA